MKHKIAHISVLRPLDCPYRKLRQECSISFIWMTFCHLKKGIVCSNRDVFCDACPLEDAGWVEE